MPDSCWDFTVSVFFPIPSQAERWRWNPESHFSCGVTVAMGKELREWHKPPASSRSSNRCLQLVLELLQWPELFCCERHRALCSSSLSKHPRHSTMPQVAIRENSDRLQDTSPCFPGSLWSSFNTHTHTQTEITWGEGPSTDLQLLNVTCKAHWHNTIPTLFAVQVFIRLLMWPFVLWRQISK